VPKCSLRERWSSIVQCAAFLKSLGLQKGDRVLLLFDHCVEFDAVIPILISLVIIYSQVFLGCALLGVVPVPSYPPNPYKMKAAIDKLDLVVQDCSATLCLVSSTIMTYMRLASTKLRIPLVSSESIVSFRFTDIHEEFVQSCLNNLFPHDLLFLQYTSGSTGNPKGVMVLHSQMCFQCVDILPRAIGKPDLAGVGDGVVVVR
jgi:acyl-CoA synthetase (AMP-forming)/AMP-acid ligase II